MLNQLRRATTALFPAAILALWVACAPEGVSHPSVSPPESVMLAKGKVASVVVTPASDTVAVGDTITWVAQAVDASGNPVTSGVTYTWGNPGGDLFSYVLKSGNTAKGRANTVGQDTAIVTVSASGGPFTGRGHLLIVTGDTTPPPPVVDHVHVSPATASIEVAQTQQFAAEAHDAAHVTIANQTFEWTSSATGVATVDAHGLATGTGAGTASISASTAGKTAAGELTVATPPPVVDHIHVTPATASVQVGATQQFSAEAHEADHTVVVGQAFVWTSSSANVATVDQSGLATGVAAGTATITAEASGQSAGAALTVTAPPQGNEVILSPGESIQAAVNANPAGTAFRLTAGVYMNQRVVPKTGNTFSGNPGAILDGGGTTLYAFDKGSAPYPSDVTIRGLEIRAYASPDHFGPIFAGGHSPSDGTQRWTVDSVDIHNNRVGGVRVGHYTKVTNSKLHHNGWFGLSGAGDSVVIENNEINHNNVVGTPGTVSGNANSVAGGFKFVYTRWLVVRNNFVHHNYGAGMWTDINNIYTLYEGNQVEDNTHVGIFHEISYDAVIRNNTVLRNGFGKPTWLWGPGILIAASPRVEVYGNTVAGNFNGITVVQQTRNESASYGPHLVDDVWIHDNDVDMSAGGLSGFAQDVGNNALFDLSIVRFSDNRYVLTPTSKHFHWLNGTRTDAEWKGYGHDINGTFTR